jgi:hypothetical protein
MNDEDRLTVTLTAAEWNRVFALMGEQPLKVCGELVFKIRDQCMTQQRPPDLPPPPVENAHAPD